MTDRFETGHRRSFRPAVALAVLALLVAGARLPAQTSASQSKAGAVRLPPTAEKTYQVVAAALRPERAMALVDFMDGYWRIAGNTGFNATLERIEDGLAEA